MLIQQEQNAENIIESTEKSLYDLAERGSFNRSFFEIQSVSFRSNY